MTDAEALLWYRLRLRIDGLVFKRQQPIGPYILDFFCYRAQLAIEVDGAEHGSDEQGVRDEARDRYFAHKGIETYRISAAEVFRDVDGVTDGVRLLAEERASKLSKKPHHHVAEEATRSPSPTSGEE